MPDMNWGTSVPITDADTMTPEELAEVQRKFREFPAEAVVWQSIMPDQEDLDFADDVCAIIDWIDQANSLSDEDPESDDDESSGTSDPMDGWELDGEEDDDPEDDDDEV